MNQKGQFSLRLIQKCPVCNQDFSTGRIQILDEENNSFLAYLTCANCRSSILVRVMTLPHGLVGNAILTDLNSEEVISFSEEEQINSNDVLFIYDYLAKKGDFIERLKQL
ncbi:hypothetical protein KKF32_02915 [Patescibacteria group bacterium]|nr:hypothetical protein [Patescibacteria group bacterium]